MFSRKVSNEIFAVLIMIGLSLVFLLLNKNTFQHAELPGKLHKSHAHLETDCAACHSNSEPMNQSCLNCHKEIDISENSKDYHARIARNISCSGCHKEHLGQDSRLIRWELFEHRSSRYWLFGYHRYAGCESCHGDISDNRSNLREKKSTPHKTLFMVDDHRCVGCHLKDDVHNNKFGANCQKCHPVHLRFNE